MRERERERDVVIVTLLAVWLHVAELLSHSEIIQRRPSVLVAHGGVRASTEQQRYHTRLLRLNGKVQRTVT